MHHVALDQWSRGASVLHRRDARVKILALVAFLIAVATLRVGSPMALIAFGVLASAGILAARVPPGAMLLRAAVVLPFAGVFAIISLATGHAEGAVLLAAKSYLSACAVLLLVATTPLPKILAGLESLGLPRFLLLVVQFVYRYLFVISEQAQHMRQAAASRGAGNRRRSRSRAAAGALAVLFARSHGRAEAVYRAMASRGFSGTFPQMERPRLRAADVLFLLTALTLVVAIRTGAEVLR